MTQFAKVTGTKAGFLGADIIVILVGLILGMGIADFLTVGNSAFLEKVYIDPSLTSLPKYALLSFIRSLLSLILSYIFAIIYGTLAANNKHFERFLIPLLDVLQSLPVIAFLPGIVLSLISVFHSTRWGLELACILTIFTGQVWNLAFAYYESQRTLQPEFVEVAKIAQLTKIQKFFYIDFPNGYRPLIYNGMMSMAGGWFFLTTCEAFTLGNKDFRLPGLGSYLSESFSKGNFFNFSIALIVLMLLIVGTDLLLWKPLLAWSTRFRDGDDGTPQVKESLFLSIIHQTNIPSFLMHWFRKFIQFIFPKSDFSEEGSIRRSLINSLSSLNTISLSFFPKNWSIGEKVARIKRSSILPMIVTFAIGGIVFSLLPKIPSLGLSMATLTSHDWFILINAVFFTGGKVLLVIIISSIWAIPVGLILGLNKKLERIFQPIIQNLAAFPAPVLFPLIALVMYQFELPAFVNATFLMCIGSQWYILFNVIAGAARIPADLKFVARIYKFTLLQRFYRLYFPAILPSLTTGLLTAAGGAWNASMIAEVVDFPGGRIRSEGIGAEMAAASAEGNYPRLIAAIICTVVALVILNRTVWHTLHIYAERVKD